MNIYGKTTEQVARRIVEAFQQPDKLPKAIAPIFIRRKDDIPCRRWSWHNQILVALAGTADARGIKQWNHVGRKVKSGSSALWILAPCTKTIREKTTNEDKVRTILYGFRAIPVFALEDTEGEALCDQRSGCEEFIANLPLLEVTEQWGITVDAYSHHPGDPMGFYRHRIGAETIMLGVEDVPTWLHELMHAADKRVGGLEKATWHKEIVAELGSAVLASMLGRDATTNLGGAYEYIEHYATSANMSTVKACIDVLDHTCRCVALILDTADALDASRVTL